MFVTTSAGTFSAKWLRDVRSFTEGGLVLTEIIAHDADGTETVVCTCFGGTLGHSIQQKIVQEFARAVADACTTPVSPSLTCEIVLNRVPKPGDPLFRVRYA